MGAGHKVTILCWDRLGKSPKTEEIDGIHIIRLGPLYTKRELGKFPIKLIRFWMKAFSAARHIKPDVVHAHDFDTLPLGFDISRFHGARLVYDAHEIYSAMLGPDGQDSVLGRFIDRLEAFFARRADRVITVSDGLAARFKDRGVTAIVVTNCPLLTKVDAQGTESLRAKHSLGNDFIVLYIGVLEPDRFLEEAVKAVRASSLDGVRLVIGGFGTLEARIKELARDSENVIMLGKVHPSLVVPYTGECDAVLCIFDPMHNLNNRLGAPNKLFEAMMASRPVLVAKGTEAANLVGRERSGVAVDYAIESLLPAIKQLMDNPDIAKALGQNARKAAEDKYNWEAVSKGLAEAYASL